MPALCYNKGVRKERRLKPCSTLLRNSSPRWPKSAITTRKRFPLRISSSSPSTAGAASPSPVGMNWKTGITRSPIKATSSSFRGRKKVEKIFKKVLTTYPTYAIIKMFQGSKATARPKLLEQSKP